jgi:hypothetical protein
MTGVPGFLQKHLNGPVFEKHVPLDRERLMKAHEGANLITREADYLVSSNFGVVNLDGLERGSARLVKKSLLATLSRASLFTWYVDERIVPLPATPWLSPYVYCLSERIHAT